MSSAERVVDVPLPLSHLDLLIPSATGVLSTIDAGGSPRSALVSVVCASSCAAIAVCPTQAQRDDIGGNSSVSVLVVDAANTARFIEIRGDAEPSDYAADGAPDAGRGSLFVVHPRRITLDAIHP